MALSFSRSLLAGLTNPNFGDIEGLGKQIGSAKAMSDRRNMLLGMMDNPVDLANLAVSDAARTGDATAVLQATQARDSVVSGELRTLSISLKRKGSPHQRQKKRCVLRKLWRELPLERA